MEIEHLLWLIPCALISQIVGTIAGFGSATLLTPIATLILDVKEAIAVVACFHLLGNVSRLFAFWKHVDWRVWAEFGLVAVVSGAIGATVTAVLPSAGVRIALGVFLIVYVIMELTHENAPRVPKTRAGMILGGLFSGFVAGLIGTGGAIRSAYLLSSQMPAEAYLGTSAAIVCVVDAVRLFVYVSQGFISKAMLLPLVALIPSAFIGTWIGRWLVDRMSRVIFMRIVLGLLAIMGLKFIIEGWLSL